MGWWRHYSMKLSAFDCRSVSTDCLIRIPLTESQLFDSEMRSAVAEAETREEVMREMEERISEMEKRFARRLMSEVRLSG
jgi:hypothetical protein